MTTAASTQRVIIGNRNDNPTEWSPFEWEDPKYGPQVKGEIAVIRPDGTSGALMAGLWRTGRRIPGCEPDGTCIVDYTAPLGDETMVILEGAATINEVATGRIHKVSAGSIVANPKNVDLQWEITSAFLKKFWVMWDSETPGTPETDLIIGNISDDPGQWTPFRWVEPELGPQTCGETSSVRDTGSTGTLITGLRRTGIGIPGCSDDGSTTFFSTSPLGDETILILEGTAHLRDEATGEEYELKTGDVVALPNGHPVTWTSHAPYAKVFFAITSANPAATS